MTNMFQTYIITIRSDIGDNEHEWVARDEDEARAQAIDCFGLLGLEVVKVVLK